MNKPLEVKKQISQYIYDEGQAKFLEIINNVIFYKWLYFITVSIVTVISICYVLFATPVFVADLLIQVEDKKSSSISKVLDEVSVPFTQTSSVTGEIEIVQSRSVLGRAVELLGTNITITVENRIPFVGNWLSRTLPKNKNGFTEGLWESKRYSWGGEMLELVSATLPEYLLTYPLYLKIYNNDAWELINDESEIIDKGSAFENNIIALNGELIFKIKSLKAQAGTVFKIVVVSVQSEINRMRERLKVTETKRQSGILTLSFESSNARTSALVLNSIADIYVKRNIEKRSEETEQTLKFLAGELPRLRKILDQSEVELNRFRSDSYSVDIGDESQELLKLSTLIETKKLDLELRKRDLLQNYGKSHPLINAINSQLERLRKEEQIVANKINLLPGIQQDYIRLQRDVDVNNDLYVSLLNTVQQLQIANAGTIGNVSLIDRAVVPENPRRPQKKLIVCLGFILGNLLGFFLVQMIAFISQIIRDPRKFEAEIHLPILAILPMDANQNKVRIDNSYPFLLIKDYPDSPVVESLSNLRTSIFFALSEKSRSKVILITSAIPNQGKTFVSSNLSYLIAATGKKVLLIDADTRQSTLGKYLKFEKPQDGFLDVLQNPTILSEVIIKNIYKNMDLLPAGTKKRSLDDLFIGSTLDYLINELVELYDYILIDSCPVLPVHGTRLLAKVADLTLFVIKQGDVNIGQVHESIDIFSKVGANIDGFIFNFFKPSSLSYGYSYSYGYSHRSYKYTNES